MGSSKYASLRDLQRGICTTYGLPEVEPEGMVAVAFETIEGIDFVYGGIAGLV